MSISKSYSTSIPISKFSLWKKLDPKRSLVSFNIELTSRCNNNCTHCYINLPANDKESQKKEMSLPEIRRLAEEAVSMGVYSCLLTGGEPLIRKDFFDIYILLKKKGFLITVFTNATLITKKHIRFFKKYPPRDFEVSVYGVTKKTYEKVTRKPGSFNAFIKGLDLLLKNGIKVRFKAMALRSNVHELEEIAQFCRERTKDYFRFDPLLHLRYDGDKIRNIEIKSERLSYEEIAEIEQSDKERFQFLEKNIDKYIHNDKAVPVNDHLFSCGVGNSSFTMGANGYIRACSSLLHPDFIYNWRNGTLSDAWNNFIPKVLNQRTQNRSILEKCKKCNIVNLCMWCPAHAYLETGKLDGFVEYFCKVAHARAEILNKPKK